MSLPLLPENDTLFRFRNPAGNWHSIAEKLPMLYNQFLIVVDFTIREMVYFRGNYKFLGFEHELINQKVLESLLHPAESKKLVKVVCQAAEMLINENEPEKYLLNLTCRIKKFDGAYQQVLSQVYFYEQPENSGKMFGIILSTDLSLLNNLDFSFKWQLTGPNATYISNAIKKENVTRDKKLTQRELHLLKLLAEGKESKEIADLLNISIYTVNTHRKNMLSRLKLKNTVQLISFAYNRGLI
jgi:DNA-binding CsgD family transcriptional regulator